ncbi:hypothetical protein AAFC00_003319 [Neodothiora populina]|uniref:Acyl-CoA N-acyltransferase n=1 Tax=Neodothiora populina TaxID=2781224 RepID=A0ABR3PA07_9PEZI
MPWGISEATPADIPTITSIFLSEDESANPFMQLCLGSVNRYAVNMRQSTRISEALNDPDTKYMIARDRDSKKTASFAQWQLPRPPGDAVPEMDADEVEAEHDAYRKALTPGMNAELCVRFKDEIESLRARVLKGRSHYLLMNLGTAHWAQRKGAATSLVSWPFAIADETNTLVYLDTAIDGPGRQLYEKLDFKPVGECSIDLAQYGGQGCHVHVAMIRYPQGKKDEGVEMPDFGGA